MQSKSYIEFVGVAGSGKSEVAQLLVRTFSAQGREVVVRAPLGHRPLLKLKLCGAALAALCRMPAVVASLIVWPRDVYHHTPHVRATLTKLAVRTLIECVVIAYIVKNDTRTLLNDEGLVGKVVSLSVLAGISHERVVAILEQLLPMHTTFIFVETPPHVAMEREAARSVVIPFFRDMDAHTKIRFFEEATALYGSVLETLEQAARVRVIRVRNDKDKNTLTQDVSRIAGMIG